MTARRAERVGRRVRSEVTRKGEHHSRTGLYVFCGTDAFGRSGAESAASAAAAGLPSIVVDRGGDYSQIAWPPVALACLFSHAAWSDRELQALAASMVDAGVDRVAVSGERAGGGFTFVAS